MQRTVITAMTIIAVSFAGCSKGSSNNSSSAPKAAVNHQNTPAWTLEYQSVPQDSTASANTVAAYGFSVDADGNYIVGPSPAGKTKSGTLTSDELHSLTELVANGDSTLVASDVQHLTFDTALTTSDTLKLKHQSGQEVVLIQESGTDFAYQTVTSDQADALLQAVQGLAGEYYTLPFPDACQDSADSTSALYAPLASCSVDADCAYIDSGFEAIPSNVSEWVTTDDCSIVSPLYVANANAVETQKVALQKSLDQTRTTCGDRIVRSDCTGVKGFDASVAAPVCQNNRCVANPSIAQ